MVNRPPATIMQNYQQKTARLRAFLENGLIVSISCEEVNSFHKTFLRGMVHTLKYKVTVLEPKDIPCKAVYEPRLYQPRWWWGALHGERSRAAVAIHLLSLKAKLAWHRYFFQVKTQKT